MARGAPKTQKPQSRFDPPDLNLLTDFSQDEVAEIREAFDVFDKSGKGLIDLNEMLDYMEGLKVHNKYITIFTLIDKLASQFPNGISFKEFMEHIQFMLGDTKTGPGLTRFFELLDVEDKKVLDKPRLRELSREIGENISDKDLDELIDYYFECPNGKVDMDKFYRMMIKDVF